MEKATKTKLEEARQALTDALAALPFEDKNFPTADAILRIRYAVDQVAGGETDPREIMPDPERPMLAWEKR